jgi:hypothetical protein
MKTNDARIALVTRMSAGHFGAAGRFEGLDEVGLIQAFALGVTGMYRADDAVARDAPPPAQVVAPRAAPMRPSDGAAPKR